MDDWLTTILKTLIGPVLAVFGWFIKGIKDDMGEIKRAHAEHVKETTLYRSHVAENYTTKDDLKQAVHLFNEKMDRVDDTTAEIQKDIKTLLSRPFNATHS